MNEITPFEFQGNQVRVVTIDGEPWWLAKDVCDVLDLDNTGQALGRLEDDEKDYITISDGTPGTPHRAVISESGLYSLILTSRKPEAKSFKRWVTHEVLPSIRKTGAYVQSGATFQIPQTMPEALRLAADALEQNAILEAQVQVMAPKAEFFDQVVLATDGQSIQACAKVLGTGQNRLFKWLRENGFLMGNNQPYQKYIDQGYFRVIEQTYQGSTSQHNTTKTLLTGKGLTWLEALLRSQDETALFVVSKAPVMQ